MKFSPRSFADQNKYPRDTVTPSATLLLYERVFSSY